MLGPLANGIVTIIELILRMVQILIFASIIISWVGADPGNQIVQMVRALTEPMYRPLRKLTKKLPGPMDWAPLVLMLVVIFVEVGILPYIRMLAGGGALPHGG